MGVGAAAKKSGKSGSYGKQMNKIIYILKLVLIFSALICAYAYSKNNSSNYSVYCTWLLLLCIAIDFLPEIKKTNKLKNYKTDLWKEKE